MEIGSIGIGCIVDKFSDATKKLENISINAMYSRNYIFVMIFFGIPTTYQYFPLIEKGIYVFGVTQLQYNTYQVICVASKNYDSKKLP